MDTPSLFALAQRAPMLDEVDERALIRAAQAGDGAARDRIVLAHLRLAVAGVRRFKRVPVPVDDLVQDAVCGLLAALDKFDLAQPVRFGTYASWWVRSEAGAGALRMAGPVSVHASNPAARAAYYGGALAAVSMDEPLGEDGLTRGEAMADPGERHDAATERVLEAEARRAALGRALGRLTERERVIVTARHAVDDEDVATLDTLSRRFGVTRERVRQIEGKAIEKLRGLLARDERASLAA